MPVRIVGDYIESYGFDDNNPNDSETVVNYFKKYGNKPSKSWLRVSEKQKKYNLEYNKKQRELADRRAKTLWHYALGYGHYGRVFDIDNQPKYVKTDKYINNPHFHASWLAYNSYQDYKKTHNEDFRYNVPRQRLNKEERKNLANVKRREVMNKYFAEHDIDPDTRERYIDMYFDENIPKSEYFKRVRSLIARRQRRKVYEKNVINKAYKKAKIQYLQPKNLYSVPLANYYIKQHIKQDVKNRKYNK